MIWAPAAQLRLGRVEGSRSHGMLCSNTAAFKGTSDDVRNQWSPSISPRTRLHREACLVSLVETSNTKAR